MAKLSLKVSIWKLSQGKFMPLWDPTGQAKVLFRTSFTRTIHDVTDGSVEFLGKDIVELDPHERASEGLFLAFQYPIEIPGVNNIYFLRAALNAQRKYRGEEELDSSQFMRVVKEKMKGLGMDSKFLQRPVNEGFSGGEKKRNEILQMTVLEPKLAVLDETDSGLDIDALKVVSDGVNALRNSERSFVVITHYQRLLDHIVPDYVHVLAGGRIPEDWRQGIGARA